MAAGTKWWFLMLRENGKRLPSLLEFASLLMPMNCEVDESWINRYGAVSEFGIDPLIPVETAAGRYRFMPGPEFSPRLYRGQNQFFTKCIPSIYRVRGDIDAPQVRHFLDVTP
jgi:hypothetical protein